MGSLSNSESDVFYIHLAYVGWFCEKEIKESSLFILKHNPPLGKANLKNLTFILTFKISIVSYMRVVWWVIWFGI